MKNSKKENKMKHREKEIWTMKKEKNDRKAKWKPKRNKEEKTSPENPVGKPVAKTGDERPPIGPTLLFCRIMRVGANYRYWCYKRQIRIGATESPNENKDIVVPTYKFFYFVFNI